MNDNVLNVTERNGDPHSDPMHSPNTVTQFRAWIPYLHKDRISLKKNPLQKSLTIFFLTFFSFFSQKATYQSGSLQCTVHTYPVNRLVNAFWAPRTDTTTKCFAACLVLVGALLASH